jgi:hypothetical protein
MKRLSLVLAAFLFMFCSKTDELQDIASYFNSSQAYSCTISPTIELFCKDLKCAKFLEFSANIDSIPIDSYHTWQVAASQNGTSSGVPSVTYIEYSINRDSLREAWLCDCDTGEMHSYPSASTWLPVSGTIKATRTKLDTTGNAAYCRISVAIENLKLEHTSNDNLSLPNVKLDYLIFDSIAVHIRM